jgi:centractin
VTQHLQFLLRKAGYNFLTSAEQEIVRLIKEKCCYLALQSVKDHKQEKFDEFVLPDGQVVRVIPLSHGTFAKLG